MFLYYQTEYIRQFPQLYMKNCFYPINISKKLVIMEYSIIQIQHLYTNRHVEQHTEVQPINLQINTSSFFFETSAYNFVTTQVWSNGKEILATLNVNQKNGYPLLIRPPFTSSFLELVNGKKQNIQFTIMDSNYNLSINWNYQSLESCSREEIHNSYILQMKEASELINRALQIIGKQSRFNRIQKILKNGQLEMRKQAIRIIGNPDKANLSFQKQPSKKQIFQQEKISAVKNVSKILQIQNLKHKTKTKKGGYCYVEPVRCLISQSGEEYEQILAVKRSKIPGNINICSKINKQLQIVKRISNSQHSCNYYSSGENPHVYMSYVPKTLRDYISRKNTASDYNVQKIINIGKQIIAGVKILHDSGIIHRDLKPENILISQNNGKETVHIIDFGQSTTVDSQYNKSIIMGSTFPYSPIECALGRQEGFNHKTIDLWSVNIILYQMIYRCLPISYNKSISLQIIEDWRTSPLFTTHQIYRKKKGIAGIGELISLISMSGLQVNPKQRLSLGAMNEIFSFAQKYYKKCTSIN